MSADNGIYVLVTKSPFPDGNLEYRVAHAQAIDNIYYDVVTGKYESKFIPEIACEYFGKSEVFFCLEDASEYAHELADNEHVLEYGVCNLFHTDQEFVYFSNAALKKYDRKMNKTIKGIQKANNKLLDDKRKKAEKRFRAPSVFHPKAIHGKMVMEDGREVRGTLKGVTLMYGDGIFESDGEVIFLPSDWSE